MVLLFIFFFPAGIIMAVMVNKKLRMNCPVCTKHTRHWSNLGWFGGLGWMIIPIGVFASLYIGGVMTESSTPAVTVQTKSVAPGSVDEAIDMFADGISDSVDDASDRVDAAVDKVTDAVDDAIEGRRTNRRNRTGGTTAANSEASEQGSDENVLAEAEFGDTFEADTRIEQTSDENPFLIVCGILLSVAMYVIPLVRLGCTRVAVEQITDKTVTFKRASTIFAQAVQKMQIDKQG
jgi:hypothetical protein